MNKKTSKPNKSFSNNYKKLTKEKQETIQKPVTLSPVQSAKHEQPNQAKPLTCSQTIQQERARFALTQITASAEHLQGNDRKEFLSHAASFPSMIQMNGLGQAAAFYLSKGGQHKVLYDMLSTWLTQDKKPYAEKTNLIAGITQSDMHTYRLAQAEALSLLDWVKKFAKAYLKEEARNEPAPISR